jgi:hypothetical protein
MRSSIANVLPAADFDRLSDFYAYVLDARREERCPPAGASRATTLRSGAVAADLVVVETIDRHSRNTVIVDVVDDQAWRHLRRRLLCLAATDGIVRNDGVCHWLGFRDPEGSAVARLAMISGAATSPVT